MVVVAVWPCSVSGGAGGWRGGGMIVAADWTLSNHCVVGHTDCLPDSTHCSRVCLVANTIRADGAQRTQLLSRRRSELGFCDQSDATWRRRSKQFEAEE